MKYLVSLLFILVTPLVSSSGDVRGNYAVLRDKVLGACTGEYFCGAVGREGGAIGADLSAPERGADDSGE